MSDDGRSQASGQSGLSGTSGLTGISGVGGQGGSDVEAVGDTDSTLTAIRKALRAKQEVLLAGLSAVSKSRWEADYRIAIFILLLDFIQVALFIMDPVFGWDIEWDGNIALRWIRRMHLQNEPARKGYTFWLGCFYATAVTMLFMVLVTYFTGLKAKRGLEVLQATRVLRLLTVALLQTFYVSVLNMFMLALFCNWGLYGGVPEAPPYLVGFPDQKCLALPHIIQGALAIIFVPIWIFFGYTYASSYMTPNPLTKEPLGQAHSVYNQRALVYKTLLSLTFFTLAAGGQLKLLSLFFLVITVALLYESLAITPFFVKPLNVYLAWANGTFFFGALTLVVHVHGPAKWYARDTIALLVGSPLFGLAVGAAKFLQMRLDERIGNRFLREAEEALSKDPHLGSNVLATSIEFHYQSAFQVEAVARILRRRTVPGAEPALPLRVCAETIMLTGIRQFPESSLLHSVMGNYRMFVTKDFQSATSSADRARALAQGLAEVALAFALELEVLSKTVNDGGGAENTMDLAAYVEFQNTYAALLKVHRAAYRGERKFWRLCAQNNLTFGSLSAALDAISLNEQKTDRAYKAALEKYPKNVTLLRSYGRFLEELRNDPYAAQKHYAEAEKLEESAAADAGDEESGQVNDKRDAVVVISSNGIIKIANKNLHQMFGYKGDYLIGKNVSTLMPPPYNSQHNSYLKRYAQTQKSTIINIRQKLEGKHKLGHTFPLSLLVSRVESAGETNFMGVIAPRVEDGVVLSLTSQGGIRSVNPAFTDMFGYNQLEMVGRPFAELLKLRETRELVKLIAQISKGKTQDTERSFDARHASGTIFPISVAFSVERSGDKKEKDANGVQLGASVTAKITSLADNIGVITIDEVGNIQSSNAFISKIFGYPADQLKSMNIAGLMPRPYSRFHASYLKRFRDGGGGAVVGDTRGRIVSALHKDGRIFQIRLEVHEITESSGGGAASGRRLFSGRITMTTSETADRRNCRLRINKETGMITKASDTLEELFGWKAESVENALHIADLIESEKPYTKEALFDLIKQMPSHCRQPDGDEKTDLQGIQDGPHPYLRCVVRVPDDEQDTDKKPVSASLEIEPALVAGFLDVMLWSTGQLEGVISINATGTIVECGLGVQAIFGFRGFEMLGQNVTMLMSDTIGRVHGLFLSRFADARSRKMVGTRRIVEARHRDGSVLRIALEVSDAERNQAGKPAFSARVVLTDEPLSDLPKEVAQGAAAAADPAAAAPAAPAAAAAQHAHEHAPPAKSGKHAAPAPHALGKEHAAGPQHREAFGSQARSASPGPVAEAVEAREPAADADADAASEPPSEGAASSAAALAAATAAPGAAYAVGAVHVIQEEDEDEAVSSYAGFGGFGMSGTSSPPPVAPSAVHVRAGPVVEAFGDDAAPPLNAERTNVIANPLAARPVPGAMQPAAPFPHGVPLPAPLPVPAAGGAPAWAAAPPAAARAWATAPPPAMGGAPAWAAVPAPAGMPPFPPQLRPGGWPAGVPFPPPNLPAHLLAPPNPLPRASPRLPSDSDPALLQAPRAAAVSPAPTGPWAGSGAPPPGGKAPSPQPWLRHPSQQGGARGASPGMPLHPGHPLASAFAGGKDSPQPPAWARPAATASGGSPRVSFAAGAIAAAAPPRPSVPPSMYPSTWHGSSSRGGHSPSNDAAPPRAMPSQADSFAAPTHHPSMAGIDDHRPPSHHGAARDDDAASYSGSEEGRTHHPGHAARPSDDAHAHPAGSSGHRRPHKKLSPLIERFLEDSVACAAGFGSSASPPHKGMSSATLPGGRMGTSFRTALTGVASQAHLSEMGGGAAAPGEDGALGAGDLGGPADGALAVPPPLDIVPAADEPPKPEEQKQEDQHGLEADFARARRYKQITRMLSNPKMREAVDRLKRDSKVIAVLCVLVYLSSIVTIRIMVITYNSYMVNLADSGLASIAVMRACINTVLIGSIMKGLTIQNEDAGKVVAALQTMVDELDELAKTMYLGTEDTDPPQGILDVFNDPFGIAEQRWVPTATNTSAGYWAYRNVTLWDAVNSFVAAGREIAGGGKNLTYIEEFPSYRYMLANGPVQIRAALTRLANALSDLGEKYLEEMELAQIVLLCANAVVFFSCILYFRVLLYNVSLERLNLFQIFLAVPKNVVFKLASKTVKLGDEDEGDESEEDDDWAHRMELQQNKEQTEQQKAKEEAAGDHGHSVALVTSGDGAAFAPSGKHSKPHDLGASIAQSEMEHGGDAAAGDLGASTLQPPPPGAVPHAPLVHASNLRKSSRPTLRGGDGKSKRGNLVWDAEVVGKEPPEPAKEQHKRPDALLLASVASANDGADGDGDGGGAGKGGKLAKWTGSAGGVSGQLVAASLRLKKRALRLVGRSSAAEPGLSPTAAGPKKARRRKHLRPQGAANYSALAPICIAAVMAIAGFSYSLQLINDSVPTVMTELRASRTYAIAYRVRFFAFCMVARPLNTTLDYNRNSLSVGIRDFEISYNATVYGDAALGNQQILTMGSDHDELLFTPSCLRTTGSCYPATHPWYATSTKGLDTAVKSYIEVARLFLGEPASALTLNNTHLNYVWAIGKNDLGGGLDKLLELTHEDTLSFIQQAQDMQIILLVVAVFLNFVFFGRYFLPWLTRTMGENKRVAHLLSDLPQELSVEKLLSETLSMGEDGKPQGIAAADAS